MDELVLTGTTAVAVAGRALLIQGEPGSGKSSLALALIDRGAALIGDDAVTLRRQGAVVWASPPPRIAGLLEVRGVGLVPCPTTAAPVALLLRLDPAAERMPTARTHALLDTAAPLVALRPHDSVLPLRAERALEVHGLRF